MNRISLHCAHFVGEPEKERPREGREGEREGERQREEEREEELEGREDYEERARA